MYIGHLHSCFQDNKVLNYFDAILIRTDFETWDYCKKHNVDFLNCFYGQYSQRAKLRELIYPNLTYYNWFNLMKYYELIFLSINFDVYPTSNQFTEFTKDIVKTFKKKYPNKDFILGAGNETQEKRQSAEKVMETAIDVYYGARNAGILEPKICIYNQKIKTQEEQKCVKQILNDDFIQHYVNYFGYQSLETTPARLKEYITLIKEKGFEPVDVEIGTTTNNYSEIKNLFDVNRLNGVNKVFILTPYISTELANYDPIWKKYTLSYDGIYKDKYKIIQYAIQYKTKEEFIIGDDMKLYLLKKGVKGNFVKWLQEILEIEYGFENVGGWDGDFGTLTENQVKEYQTANNLLIDGIVGKDTTIDLVEDSQNPNYWFRKLQIMIAFEK